MTVRTILKSWLVFSLLGFSVTAWSSSIFYEVSSLGANSYSYDYTVENQSASPIDEFTIYFDLGVFENLSVTASPADWDSIAIQPDPFLPDDGFFDSLALVNALLPGETLAGFSVRFDYLRAGTPGSQSFEIVNPFTFAVISTGFTQPLPTASVPEPPLIALLGLGLLFMTLLRRAIRVDK